MASLLSWFPPSVVVPAHVELQITNRSSLLLLVSWEDNGPEKGAIVRLGGGAGGEKRIHPKKWAVGVVLHCLTTFFVS